MKLFKTMMWIGFVTAAFVLGTEIASADAQLSLSTSKELGAFNIGQYEHLFTVERENGSKITVYFEPNADIGAAEALYGQDALTDGGYILFKKLTLRNIVHECVHASYRNMYWQTDISSPLGQEQFAYEVDNCFHGVLNGFIIVSKL